MILKGPHFSKLSLASSKSEQEWKFEERMFYSFFFFFYILHFAVFFMFSLSCCYCYDFPKYSLPFSSWSSISGQFYIQKTLSYHCSQSPCQNRPWNRFIADKKDRRLNISLYRSVSLKVKVIKL